MFNFICRTFPYVRISPTYKLYLFHYHPLSSTTLQSISNQPSFTVTYLINSCGFPPQKALSASNYVNFKTPKKPDSVLAFFNNHGFTKTQISKLIRRLPPVLLCDPEKTLLPKFEFFYSLGISSSDVAKILSSAPMVLKRSLENQIIPAYNYLRNLFQSDEKTINALKRFGGLLCYDLQNHTATNIEILRELGVPESSIVVLLTTYQPRAMLTSSDTFKKTVEEVKEMGFNPLRINFVLAVHVLRGMRKSTWEKKVDVYKKWGWSEDDIFVAFGKNPWCMMASEDKIMGVMDFLVNKMGWESSAVARRPGIVSYSLEKRIIPRGLFYQVLLEKGFIKKDFSLNKLLESPEKKFINQIKRCCKEEALEFLRLYQVKMNLSKK